MYDELVKKYKARGVNYLVGVDEAGRGAVAGPVSVGAVVIPIDYAPDYLEEIRDSKQLAAHKRDIWRARILEDSSLKSTVSMVGARHIDRKGIVPAVRLAIARSLKRLNQSVEESAILLDGALVAPYHYRHQETIIKGDERVPLIGMASILAKVHRDSRMRTLSYTYPLYGFEGHKGYATDIHRRAIKRHGLTPEHRSTFCGFA